MRTDKTVNVLIVLPVAIKEFLDRLKQLEGVTISGYIRQELEHDLQARCDSGWNPVTGWKALDDPAYQRRMAKAGRVAEQLIVKRAKKLEKQIEKRNAAEKAARQKGR